MATRAKKRKAAARASSKRAVSAKAATASQEPARLDAAEAGRDARLPAPASERQDHDLRVQVSHGPGASGRRVRRKPWTARVELFGASPQGVSAARTTNLSSGGVFVETPVLLDVGDPVVLTFQGPAGEALRVSGRVRWMTPFGTLDDPRPGMGIEFTGLDDARRRRVEALFERLPGAAREDTAE